MPTVSSIIRQSNMVGQLSHNLFKLDMAAADDSLLVGATIRTSGSLIKSDFGGQPALTTMVENYTEDKNNFRSELKDAMANLQKSSEQLKNSVQSEGETAQEVSAEESTDTESTSTVSAQTSQRNQTTNIFNRAELQNNDLQARQVNQVKDDSRVKDNFQKFTENYLVAENSEEDDAEETSDDKLNGVQNFVRDYNNAVSYLNENRLSASANFLNRNDELTKSLNDIGISVNSSGELSVNEETLTNALQNDSAKVGSLLGDDGLAGRLDRLNQQSENLFPSIVDYANQRQTNRSESLYSARTMATAAYTGIRAGNLVNAFT